MDLSRPKHFALETGRALRRRMQRRDLSPGDVALLFAALGIRIVIFALGLGLTANFVKVSVPAAAGSPSVPAAVGVLAGFRIWPLVLVACGLALLDMAKDAVNRRRHTRPLQNNHIYPRVVSSTAELIARRAPGLVHTVLTHIEKIVRLEVGIDEASDIHLTSNVMEVEGDNLELRDMWGSRLDGRTPLTLPIDRENPGPGAPRCVVLNGPQYVTNTDEHEVFRARGKDYKCILSIPMGIPGEDIKWVLNVDATKCQAFGTTEFVETVLVPRIKPLSNLLTLYFVLSRDLDQHERSKA